MQQQCQSRFLYIGLAPSSLLKDPASFSVDVASFMAKLWWEDKASSSRLQILFFLTLHVSDSFKLNRKIER